MKKLYTLYKSRRFFRKRSLSKKRPKKKYIPRIEGFEKNQKEKKKIVRLDAPEQFSFIESPREMLVFFEQARSILHSSDIMFNLQHVKYLTIDAVSVFIALIKDKEFTRGNLVLGNSPLKTELKNMFKESGFYSYVKSKITPPVLLNSSLIHKITKNKVEPGIAKRVCIMGIKFSFGTEEIFDPLYDVIIEVMQNTNNHAGEQRGDYHWWLQIYNDPIASVSKYTFLDLGVGIFESLPARDYREVLKAFGFQHNVDLVKPLFNGEIKSRTGKKNRGKGIPQVYESSKDVKFTRFILISNNVYVNLKTLETRKLNMEFKGTFFYWELANTK